MLLSRICFLCLDDNDKNLTTVFSDDGDDILLLNKIEYLLSSDLLILEPDNPERICSACVLKLNSFYEFKQSSLENAIRVKQLIRSGKMSVNKVTDQFQPNNENISSNDTEEFEEESPNYHENDNEPETDKFCKDNDGDSPGNIHEDLDDSIDVNEDNTDESFLTSVIDIKEEVIDLANSNENNIYNETQLERKQCDQNTASVSNVDPNQNQNSAMGQETNERYQCDRCERSYKHKSHLNRHFKQIHCDVADENETFQCNICDRGFEYKHLLELHLKSHDLRPNKNGKYLCAECNIRYSIKSALNNHLVTYHGVEDYKCSICNKNFLNKEYMKKHERNHKNSKKIVCEICKAIFQKKTNFKIHMKYHSKIRNFKCNGCEKTFVTKSMLTKHIKTHK